jgi:hypothetical protein
VSHDPRPLGKLGGKSPRVAMTDRNGHDECQRYISDCRTLQLALRGLGEMIANEEPLGLSEPESVRALGEPAQRLGDNLETLLKYLQPKHRPIPRDGGFVAAVRSHHLSLVFKWMEINGLKSPQRGATLSCFEQQGSMHLNSLIEEIANLRNMNMRYPFAALIIASFLDVAGAQELPPANVASVALSEQKTQVWRTFNLNPDCTAAGVIGAKVTKEGKGQVDFEENLGFSAYPHNSQKFRCNTQQTAGLSIFYTSPTGFKGTDSFEIEIVNGVGAARKASFRVRVK